MDTFWNLCANGSVQEILKCFFCDKFLSVPPIYKTDFGSVCGRCKYVKQAEDGTQWTRQTLFENIASFIIFPCSNAADGCRSQLKWHEVEDHENTCSYKRLNCPFFNNADFPVEKCLWTGLGPALNAHLELNHGALIKKLPEINFSELRTNTIFLTRILKQLMVVVVKYEDGKFSNLVMVNGSSADCDAYRYQLELYDENRRNSLILRRSRVEDIVGFEENLTMPSKMLTLELSVARTLLENSTVVMGRFGIIKKSKRDLNQANNQMECTFDENFLRELECPVCKNYMVPPIQICSTGHSFCNRCRDQMDECPTCRHPFQEGRNYTLEKLTTCINYPCMFKDAGCPVACSSEKLRDHELDCSFSGTQCFMECNAGPVVNLFNHLNEKHQDGLIVSGEVQLMDMSEECLKFFAMCFGGDVFRLAVEYDGDIKFCLQQFGVKQSCYSYELELICSVECSERIIFAKECPPMGSLFDRCVELPTEVLDRFRSEDDLIFFKVHLKKLSKA